MKQTPFLKTAFSAGLFGLLPFGALAQTLPAPFVSRAVDAVLLPVNADVIAAFNLPAGESGALVLAVQPGGIAEAAGIAPGDVIAMVQGEIVGDPVDVDAVVYYWLKQGKTDFSFDIWHAGAKSATTWAISQAAYEDIIDIATVATWSSYSYEQFSYSEFYAEYSAEMTESYASSETTIEEMTSSEEFTSEMTSEETTGATTDDTSDDAATTDTDSDGIMDAADNDDDGDGIDDATDGDDDGDGIDDAADGDAGGDDAGGDDS